MMVHQPLNLIFLGYSGSGKDTQAELLQGFLRKRDGDNSVAYIYTGQKLRDFIAQNPDNLTARMMDEKVMHAGAKAPDFLAVWAVAVGLMQVNKDQHIISSSSPRTRLEAIIIDEAFAWYERTFVFPVWLDVSYEWGFARLKNRGRKDDTDEQIRNRLDYFKVHVMPAIEYYQSESVNRLIHINGEQPIDKVHADIMQALKERSAL